jgi:hypothetical protein
VVKEKEFHPALYMEAPRNTDDVNLLPLLPTRVAQEVEGGCFGCKNGFLPIRVRAVGDTWRRALARMLGMLNREPAAAATATNPTK